MKKVMNSTRTLIGRMPIYVTSENNPEKRKKNTDTIETDKKGEKKHEKYYS